MRRRYTPTFPPVDLAHIRGHGVRSLLVYCTSLVCNHRLVMNVDDLPGDTMIASLEPRMVCTRCGRVGADIRPNWSERGVEPGWGGAHAGHDYSPPLGGTAEPQRVVKRRARSRRRRR